MGRKHVRVTVHLRSCENISTVTASEEIVETVVLLATSGQSDCAWEFLDSYLVWNAFDRIEDGGTSTLCASILQRARESCEPMDKVLSWRELSILEHVSDSKCCNKIIEWCGEFVREFA